MNRMPGEACSSWRVAAGCPLTCLGCSFALRSCLVAKSSAGNGDVQRCSAKRLSRGSSQTMHFRMPCSILNILPALVSGPDLKAQIPSSPSAQFFLSAGAPARPLARSPMTSDGQSYSH